MTWNRILSALLALIYFIVIFVHGGAGPAFKLCIYLILPMACIWFSDAMGGYEGPTIYMIPVSSSPAVLVRILGWLLLLLPIILTIYIRLAS